jgi:predicted O-methyltransferase YrrM
MIVRGGGRSGKRYHIISLIAIVITIMTMRNLITTNNNIPAVNVASEMVQPDADACCVMCSTPNDSCCLKCNDVSSIGEQDMLMAMMEGLTHHIMEKHSSKISPWMKTRAWAGNSHIGNRKEQAVFYYDWMKSLTGGDDKFRHVCEIGMNGGHSALIFLAALNAHNDKEGVELTMFDLATFDYSETARKYIEALYPNQFTLHKGNSVISVPKWTSENNTEKCDVFSIDGDHGFEGARIDILNAARATRNGGLIILDDMNPKGPTRKAFESALDAHVLADGKCIEIVHMKIGHVNRFDETNSRSMKMAWCMATVVHPP